MKKQLLILITLFTAVLGYSQTFNAFDNNNNTLQFDITSATTVRIIDYISGGTNLDIPSTVSYNSSTYSVTKIANSSLGGINLTSVILPDGLLSIGNYTFEDNQLTTIIIPNSVIDIGEQAFSNNNLTSVILSNGLIEIDDFAFEINQLTNITIPSSVTDIGIGVFMGNPSLTCVISEATTPPTISTGGANDTFSLSQRSNINLSIPTGTLGAYTAAQWTGFNSVAEGLMGTFVIDYITYQINANPNNEVTVTNYNSAGGTILNIPVTVNSGCTDFSVVSIGNEAFDDGSLTSVTIPNSVISIDKDAFNSNQITTLTIGDSVAIIGDGAFANNLIGNVIIPSSVTSIDQYAFAYNQLISIDIPDTVTSIGNAAFRNNQIASATLPNGLISIPSQLFSQNQLANISIPNTVTSIGQSAFYDNQLTSVTIPSSVTTIGSYVFQDNPLLTDVFSENITPPTITTGGTEDTFGVAQRGNINLTIPNNTQNAYIAATWINFASVTLSISNFELANDVKIFTTTNAIKITASNTIRLENFTLYSISGAKIATGKETEIPTSFLASGIYILKLNFNKGTVTKKVILK